MFRAFAEHFRATRGTALILAPYALTMRNLMFALGAHTVSAFPHVVATVFSHALTPFSTIFRLQLHPEAYHAEVVFPGPFTRC